MTEGQFILLPWTYTWPDVQLLKNVAMRHDDADDKSFDWPTQRRRVSGSSSFAAIVQTVSSDVVFSSSLQ